MEIQDIPLDRPKEENPRFEREYYDEETHKCIIQLYWIDVEKGIELWESEH